MPNDKFLVSEKVCVGETEPSKTEVGHTMRAPCLTGSLDFKKETRPFNPHTNHIASRLTVVDPIVIFSDGCAGQYKGRGSVADLTLSRWPEMHGEECNRNFDGSSGGMKATAAEVLWERSVERHRFRHTAILSDGDAKTYKHFV